MKQSKLTPALTEEEQELCSYLMEYEISNSWLPIILPINWGMRYFKWKVGRKLKNLNEFKRFKTRQHE